jgi:hypothetical protein
MVAAVVTSVLSSSLSKGIMFFAPATFKAVDQSDSEGLYNQIAKA